MGDCVDELALLDPGETLLRDTGAPSLLAQHATCGTPHVFTFDRPATDFVMFMTDATVGSDDW